MFMPSLKITPFKYILFIYLFLFFIYVKMFSMLLENDY